jgi:hypothetical protein
MSQEALEHIAPKAKVVTLADGVAISLEAIRMRQVGPLARAVDVIWPSLMLATTDAQGQPRQPQLADMVSLLAANTEELIDAVAVCSGLPSAQLQGMHPDDFALLALGCLEVNADFFARAASSLKAAAPQIAPSMLAKMQAMSPSQGPSSASPSPASGEPIKAQVRGQDQAQPVQANTPSPSTD